LARQKDENKEAWFFKKNAVGWSCVACDRALTHIDCNPGVDYSPWKKFPAPTTRDNPDKASLKGVGQGFSKLLSSISPDPNLMPAAGTSRNKKHRNNISNEFKSMGGAFTDRNSNELPRGGHRA
jgi:hypothetical protein